MISKYNLQIEQDLYDFINLEVLPGTNINQEDYWMGFSNLIKEYSHVNKKLLNKRNTFQSSIDEWHIQNEGNNFNKMKYINFLKEIKYIVPEGKDFKINTKNVDDEISNISGPQLVVPITNSRYAINAVNARWGSLYDALYGTDVIEKISNKKEYDEEHGTKVINYAKKHLDLFSPINGAKWSEVTNIILNKNKIDFHLKSKVITSLVNENQITGFILDSKNIISELILEKNNLHIRILINPENIIGKTDPANISDVILESAISTILDCEDSVATVDSTDKINAYRNFLGLMKGDLSCQFKKNNKIIKRVLNDDIQIKTLSGDLKILKGRSLMLIRNVGHLMTTSAILDSEDQEIGEGLMDVLVTALIAIHDLKKNNGIKNSLAGSIYIVKPKMHGPEEVSFAVDVFNSVENILKLPINTIKIGIMDEERRTSVNLKECIRAAESRVAFINTGFLDRTGDEIHTSMKAGPFLKKGDMKSSTWIKSYESRNVIIGLECGLQGKAQIGKGMWAMPDLMAEMMKQKINHLESGANCAWVPSPTAATLHSIHYHNVNVIDVQNNIMQKNKADSLSDLLELPLLNDKNLSEENIILEIENNAQSILGYVVRWVDQGIGCSKVPDINNIELMEDRATCRISSQALANWLEHEIITKEMIMSAFKKMAMIVDNQNKNDIYYIPMAKDYKTIAFKAACDLVFLGVDQPSGYTEPILHKRRMELKKSILS